jgi:hypothetical protein
MIYQEFLKRVIHDGIAAAERDYPRKCQASKLHGSIAGFEVCRGASPKELRRLLAEANESADPPIASQDDVDTYWFRRCYLLEINWVCNVVSALLISEGHAAIVIVEPTARGVLKAAEILGHAH